MKNLAPALWLITIIVGLPQLSETVYTPSLPGIARALHVDNALVEYTLTIYLFGFAVGTLFWGKLSDNIGRKPCMLGGLFIYVVGCIGCYMSGSIEMLMFSRFIQAFGGSVGSVLGQAICRDAFNGPERGKVYSIVGSALAFSPAIGPVVGGLMDQAFGWSSIFVLLTVVGAIVLVVTYLQLPETHDPKSIPKTSIIALFIRMATDVRVIGFGILVAACNGIGFSYYAEGSFYMIDLLGVSPSLYGLSFVGIAAAGATGGYISRRLHDSMNSMQILERGVKVIISGTAIFSALNLILFHFQETLSSSIFVAITLTSMIIIMIGSTMMIPNALALALEDYKHAAGASASIFGFFYYTVISLFTLGMGMLHNGTIIPMPLYFLAIGVLMMITLKSMVKEKTHKG